MGSNALVRIFGAHCQRDSAARGELRGDDYLARGAGFDEIVEDAVCDRFVECTLVTIGGEIEFQRLALDTKAIGNVIDIDPGKIGLTGYGTNGSEIICFEMDAVISLRSRIRKRLQAGLSG